MKGLRELFDARDDAAFRQGVELAVALDDPAAALAALEWFDGRTNARAQWARLTLMAHYATHDSAIEERASEVKLINGWFADFDVSLLRAFPNLRYVRVDRPLANLVEIAALSQLQSLEFKGVHVEDACLAAIRDAGTLGELNLIDVKGGSVEALRGASFETLRLACYRTQIDPSPIADVQVRSDLLVRAVASVGCLGQKTDARTVVLQLMDWGKGLAMPNAEDVIFGQMKGAMDDLATYLPRVERLVVEACRDLRRLDFTKHEHLRELELRRTYGVKTIVEPHVEETKV